MQQQVSSITSFTDLRVWQEVHKIAVKVYRLTKTFPKAEQHGLVSQMCTTAVAVSSNLAEGISRNTTAKKAKFYSISLGSTTELQSQLLVCRDAGLLEQDTFQALAAKTVDVHKLIFSLIKAVQAGKGICPKTIA